MTTANASQEPRVKVPAAVNEALRQAVQSFGRAAAASTAAKEATASGTSLMVQAAIKAGGLPVFEAAINSLWAEIRRNVGGIAVTLGATKGKKEYTVPSGARSTASVLRNALTLDIALAEGKQPRSFTAIRDDVRQAQAEAELAALPEGYVATLAQADAMAESAERLRSLADFLKDDSETRDIFAGMLLTMTDLLDAVEHRRAEAATKAEAEEKAGEAMAEAEEKAEEKPAPRRASNG